MRNLSLVSKPIYCWNKLRESYFIWLLFDYRRLDYNLLPKMGVTSRKGFLLHSILFVEANPLGFAAYSTCVQSNIQWLKKKNNKNEVLFQLVVRQIFFFLCTSIGRKFDLYYTMNKIEIISIVMWLVFELVLYYVGSNTAHSKYVLTNV